MWCTTAGARHAKDFGMSAGSCAAAAGSTTSMAGDGSDADRKGAVTGVVVVTGASGFIGRALCAHLVAAGRPHRGIVRALTPGVPHRATLLALGDLATAPDERLAA